MESITMMKNYTFPKDEDLNLEKLEERYHLTFGRSLFQIIEALETLRDLDFDPDGKIHSDSQKTH